MYAYFYSKSTDNMAGPIVVNAIKILTDDATNFDGEFSLYGYTK